MKPINLKTEEVEAYLRKETLMSEREIQSVMTELRFADGLRKRGQEIPKDFEVKRTDVDLP